MSKTLQRQRSLHRTLPHLYRASWLHCVSGKMWSLLHTESTSAKTINKTLHVTNKTQQISMYLPRQSRATVENTEVKGAKFAFLLYIRARKNCLSLAAFLLGPPIPADLWTGRRSRCRKQHCSSASSNHPVSMWSLTSLSTTLIVTLKKGPLKSTGYNLISAATPTEHLVLKQGWLPFFGSLSHFILQIEKLSHHTYQIHPLQLFCI